MKLNKVDRYQRYLDIVGQYAQKGCISNDYIQREAERLIEQGDLFESCGERIGRDELRDDVRGTG